jgi:hypothetical protein
MVISDVEYINDLRDIAAIAARIERVSTILATFARSIDDSLI